MAAPQERHLVEGANQAGDRPSYTYCKYTLGELFQALEEHGYDVRRGRYISIKAPRQERFVKTKTLGEEYSEESLNIRIRYREVGADPAITEDSHSNLSAANIAIIGDVRILAEQRRKVPHRRMVTAEYSVDNDLDVYKLSAQLSVINKDNISSIGDLQRRIANLREKYEKQRVEANELIEQHNALLSLLEQAREYFSLKDKSGLSDTEKLWLTICKQAIDRNDIHSQSDYNQLNDRTLSLGSRIITLMESLDKTRQRFDVYSDIVKTYGEISKGDYISYLVEEERQRQGQQKKKKPHR